MISEVFVRDASKAIEVIKEVIEAGIPTEEHLNTYVINVHGIKSALGNIGKPELSAIAGKLEKLGHDENIELIIQETGSFIESLKKVVDDLSLIEDETGIDFEEDRSLLSKTLHAIKEACDKYDEQTSHSLLTELRDKTWSKSTNDFLMRLSEYLLHSDFEVVISEVDIFIREYDK